MVASQRAIRAWEKKNAAENAEDLVHGKYFGGKK
jgi:hypothetical protein